MKKVKRRKQKFYWSFDKELALPWSLNLNRTDSNHSKYNKREKYFGDWLNKFSVLLTRHLYGNWYLWQLKMNRNW
jgi:hypothetical protein